MAQYDAGPQPSHPGASALPEPAILAERFRQQLRAGADPAQLLAALLPPLRTQPQEHYLAYARALLDAGLPAAVAALLHEAVQRWPQAAELKLWLGNALRLCGDSVRAEAVFRAALAANPAHEQAALALAHMLRDAGRLDAAAKVACELGEALGGGAQTTLRTVEFLESCRRFALADTVCETELRRGTADPRVLYASGQMALLLGRFETARERLLAAIDTGLDLSANSGAWLLLADCQRYRDPAHPDLERLLHACKDAGLSAGSRTAAAFAYGKACDDLGLWQEAAQSFAQANAQARAQHPWSVDSWNAFVEACLSRAPPVLTPSAADDTPVPVFVVGLPRSGTTLVAELLGRHSQVCNRGERSWIPFLEQQLSARAARYEPQALRKGAAVYLAQLRQDDAPARWYIDKNPLNFRHLDLVAAMLPRAHVIHCRRDRRDTALSIWMQHFEHRDNHYSYDWQGIAAFARGEERLMRHWKQVLALPILTVEYESLVQDPALLLQRLGSFLGLPEENLLAAAPKAGTAIATSSVWQARQPVYQRSVGRWQAYAPYIPQLAALEP